MDTLTYRRDGEKGATMYSTIITKEKIADLEQRGFRRWQKGNLDRLYINPAQLGLVCSYYNTGNISNATFGGESISNSRARKLKAAKTFIDIKTGLVHSDDCLLAHAAAQLTGMHYDAANWDTAIQLMDEIAVR